MFRKNFKSKKMCSEKFRKIKNKCKLGEFTKDEKALLEDVIDGLYYTDTLRVGNVIVNHLKILDKLRLILKENLIQLLNILKNIPNIQNAKNYLMICLYNNLGNTHIPTIKASNETVVVRQYKEGAFDYLYANFNYVEST